MFQARAKTILLVLGYAFNLLHGIEPAMLADPTGPSAVTVASEISMAGWTVTADSFQTGYEAAKVIDGKTNTFWQTAVGSSLPHNIIFDMKNTFIVNGISYLPRQDGSLNGSIGRHTVQLSIDGQNWATPVLTGIYFNDKTLKKSFFASTPARFVRISVQTAASGSGTSLTSAAEFRVLSAPNLALPRDNWVITADSQELGPPYFSGKNAIDGSQNTYWHTQYSDGAAPLPHTFLIDMGSATAVCGLTYLPRAFGSGKNGRIGQYRVESSTDKSRWTVATSGTWIDDDTLKTGGFPPVTARYFRLTAITEAGNRGPWTSASEINLLDGSSKLDNYQVTVDSEETRVVDNRGANAMDGNQNTFWHTAYSTNPVPGYPHNFTVDMRNTIGVHALIYTPRQDREANGRIGQHRIEVSTDGITWTNVASGSFQDSPTTKTVEFGLTQARYVRLIALSEAGNRGPWASVAEISVSTRAVFTARSGRVGSWGATIDFPLVPVSAVLLSNGKVLVWSAYNVQKFSESNGNTTITGIYDPSTGKVVQATVLNTKHDMFCPGISLDAEGRPVVTGGNSAARTSIYDHRSNQWIKASDMTTKRGYQASTILSDGRVFTIGGSWNGGISYKSGEVYDPNSNVWNALPRATVTQMLTNDAEGLYRSDNHAWLFGWKNRTVFQAGPSRAMNWYYTTGNGAQVGAGTRASDPDALNGNAVMFDAVNGKILSLGGAPSYQNSQASANAHIITIADPGNQVTVQKVDSMSYARSFANSVVLPDGKVFVIGGQSYPVPFTDDTAVFYPEIFDPDTNNFTVLSPTVVPRTYHSVALLLPDATIFSGGGGLCDTCYTNHFDAQIFSPPYLFNNDGSSASRPTISSVSPSTVKPGGSLTVVTSFPVTNFSLIRCGTVTHTVNTDQRRIPLRAVGSVLTIPSDSGIAIPGYWMLFAISSAGVPSKAQMILIQRS